VWDILEREVRLDERYDEDRLTSQEYKEFERELGEVNRLKNELYKKGTDRERLILDLHTAITLEPSGLPVLLPYNRGLSREEFQQLRSKAEPLSEERIAEEIRKAKEEFERKSKAHPGRGSPPPSSVISV